MNDWKQEHEQNETDDSNTPRKPVKNKMSFADSWKSNTFELTAAAGIIGAATYMGLTGRAPELKTGAINAGRRVFRAVGNYLDDFLPAGAARSVKNFAVKAVDRFAGRKPRETDPIIKRFDDMAANPRPLDAAATQTATESGIENYIKARAKAQELHQMKIDRGEIPPGTPLFFPKTREEFISEAIADATKNFYEQQGRGMASPNSGTGAPASGFANFTGAALAGMGFGAGLTAFHGIDDTIRQRRNDKARDRSFNAAGSEWKKNNRNDKKPFHQQNRSGGNHMNRSFQKQASVFRSIYDAVAPFAENTPKAMATGVGFTGVSLATAAMLKNHPELLKNNPIANSTGANQSSQDPSKPRIIIELGNPEHQHLNTAGVQEDSLHKIGGVMDFLRNVGGRPSDLRHLNARISGEMTNYRDEAAEALKNADVASMAKAKYGNLYNHPEASKDFMKEMFDSKAQELRRADIAKREAIQNEVAKARVLTGAGLLGTGTLAGMAYSNRNREVKP